jgi:predicted GH43/DUF377 family glycosyl hydrolase
MKVMKLICNLRIVLFLVLKAAFSRIFLGVVACLGTMSASAGLPDGNATAAGWEKYSQNPVLGGDLGTCFDISVLKGNDGYRMWFSWRPQASIALVESKDGFHWSTPLIVLAHNPESGWENDVNRPVVIKHGGIYRMWYTGQANGRSAIGYAISTNGVAWRRMSECPVLSPDQPWEKVAVMCPDVVWDEPAGIYKMWYSAGEQYEPNAIGYATSPDGKVWTKYGSNPVFQADRNIDWEKDRVTACQVARDGGWYLMFYIGFRDVDHAQIGVARSKNGIDNWQRLAANPIISPGPGQWDADACYKPFAIFDGKKWLLWYNGRRSHWEQIGVAVHEGHNLGF